MIGDVRIPDHGVIHVIIVAVPNDRGLDVAIECLILRVSQVIAVGAVVWRRSWAECSVV